MEFFRWTKDEPRPLVLNRIVRLAKSAAELLQKNIVNSVPLVLEVSLIIVEIDSDLKFKLTVTLCLNLILIYFFFLQNIFEPNLSVFDAVIYITGCFTTKKHKFFRAPQRQLVPVCDYDPVEKYVVSLRENFHSIALFFFDKYNHNDKVGVVWRRNILDEKVANVSFDPLVC